MYVVLRCLSGLIDGLLFFVTIAHKLVTSKGYRSDLG